MLRRFAGSIWALLEYGWHPFLLLLATPWFLHHLGPEKYGYWMLLTATVGFGVIMKTGTGAATIKSVSAGFGRTGGGGGAEVPVRASIAIALIGGGVLALIVFNVFFFAGERLFSKLSDTSLIQTTAIAAALLIWLEQLDNVFSSAMKGAEQFGRAAQIEMISKTVQVVVAATIVGFSTSLWVLYVGLIIVTSIRIIVKAYVTSRLLNGASLLPSIHGMADILHYAKWGWLQGIGGALFGVADRLLVGSLLGVASLTYYSIASQLAVQIHGLAAAALSVVFPMVSRKLESAGHFSLWRVAKLTIGANVLLSSVLALGLLLFGTQFLVLWIGETSALETAKILPWLAVGYWVLALGVAPYYIMLGMGRVRFVSVVVIFAGAASAIATFFAISSYGLVGAPLGRVVYGVVALIICIPLALHFRRERNNVENNFADVSIDETLQ